MIPRENVRELRDNLAFFYPRLAKEKDFAWTRLCWYLDTPSHHWIISPHPRFENVILATAGCGHAFKFFPLIGREVLALIKGQLKPELRRKWELQATTVLDGPIEAEVPADASKSADVRGDSMYRTLILQELATAKDLKAST